MDTLDIGQQWHDMQQYFSSYGSNWLNDDVGATDQILGFWDDVFQQNLGPNELNYGVSPITSMFFNPVYFENFMEFPGMELHSATEAGNIREDLTRGQFQTDVIPEYQKKIGSTGFASSGISQPLSIYDQYLREMEEIEQETSASIDQVYTMFGDSIQGQIDALDVSGGFAEDFAGGTEDNPWSEIEGEYDWSQWGFEGDFQQQLEACVTNYLGGGNWMPGGTSGVGPEGASIGFDPDGTQSDYFAQSQATWYNTSGGTYEATGPEDIFQAVEYCKQIGEV